MIMPRIINIRLLNYTIIIVPNDVQYCVPLLSFFITMVLYRKKKLVQGIIILC